MWGGGVVCVPGNNGGDFTAGFKCPSGKQMTTAFKKKKKKSEGNNEKR